MINTKIIATIGPASFELETLKKMIKSGMNVARLNFSHGEHDSHLEFLQNIRKASSDTKTPVAIIADLCGPRIRLKNLPEDGVFVKKGHTVIFSSLEDFGEFEKKLIIPVSYKNLHKDIKVGEKILIEDGHYAFKVIKLSDEKIYTKALLDATLRTKKGMNFPDTKLKIDTITLKDKKDLAFAVKNNIDFIAMSFVSSKKDIIDLRNILEREEKKYKDNDVFKYYKSKKHVLKKTRIIAKIERPEAVENIDEIIDCSDAIMVARGDLGIEMQVEKVPVIQKTIIEKCLNKVKPVIVATQMLNSMIDNQRPTRAEVSDVANAIIDGADAIMLSGETASGKYPVEAVQVMTRISKEIELEKMKEVKADIKDNLKKNISEAIGESAISLMKMTKAKAIVCTTVTGFTARNIARFKPGGMNIALTPFDYVQRQLALSWGVVPVLIKNLENSESLFEEAKKIIAEKNIMKKGESFVLVSSHPFGYSDSNLIKMDIF